MRTVKIKLNYDQLQALDNIIGNMLQYNISDYSDKCVQATLLDFTCKKIKPHLFFKFDKTKTITFTPAIGYAMMYLHQLSDIEEAYCLALMITITEQIGPKLK